MSGGQDLAALARLAALASDAAEARLAACLRQAAALRERLSELDGARHDRAARLTEADPALIAGADLRWHRWIESRRKSLNADLARTLAEIGQARDALRQAFGRKLATEEMARREKAARIIRAARHAERDQLS